MAPYWWSLHLFHHLRYTKQISSPLASSQCRSLPSASSNKKSWMPLNDVLGSQSSLSFHLETNICYSKFETLAPSSLNFFWWTLEPFTYLSFACSHSGPDTSLRIFYETLLFTRQSIFDFWIPGPAILASLWDSFWPPWRRGYWDTIRLARSKISSPIWLSSVGLCWVTQ